MTTNNETTTYSVTYTKTFVEGEELEGIVLNEEIPFGETDSAIRYFTFLAKRPNGGGKGFGSKWVVTGDIKLRMHVADEKKAMVIGTWSS